MKVMRAAEFLAADARAMAAEDRSAPLSPAERRLGSQKRSSVMICIPFASGHR